MHEGGEVTARFADRAAAGRELGALLAGLGVGRDVGVAGDVVVLGLPRGGVPVAAEVAATLNAPLDVFAVRKLGVPGHPELAMGAVATGGVRVLNDDVLAHLPGISQHEIDAVTERELAELRRREAAYRAGQRSLPGQRSRGERRPLELPGRTALLVDDGLATGATMRAAVAAARASAARQVIVAAPVASWQAESELRAQADDVVVVCVPDHLGAVGTFYADFRQVSDEQVRALLGDTQDTQDTRRSDTQDT